MFLEDWLLGNGVDVFAAVRNYTSIIGQTIYSGIVGDCDLLVIGGQGELFIVLLTSHHLHQHHQQEPLLHTKLVSIVCYLNKLRSNSARCFVQ